MALASYRQIWMAALNLVGELCGAGTLWRVTLWGSLRLLRWAALEAFSRKPWQRWCEAEATG